MYFLIACNEEPPLSLSAFTALLTISEVGGWDGFARAFFAAPFAAPFLEAEEAAEAWTGFTATAPAGCEGGDDAAAAFADASAIVNFLRFVGPAHYFWARNTYFHAYHFGPIQPLGNVGDVSFLVAPYFDCSQRMVFLEVWGAIQMGVDCEEWEWTWGLRMLCNPSMHTSLHPNANVL